MPTKDAIVVNPPRELEVPTFSKNEIIKITEKADEASDYSEVVALVNEGLQKGDIAVSGGTKLYKHTISHYTESIIVISKDANAYSTYGDLASANLISILRVSNNTASGTGYLTSDSTNIYFMGVGFSGSPSGATPEAYKWSFTKTTSITDTVTEL